MAPKLVAVDDHSALVGDAQPVDQGRVLEPVARVPGFALVLDHLSASRRLGARNDGADAGAHLCRLPVRREDAGGQGMDFLSQISHQPGLGQEAGSQENKGVSLPGGQAIAMTAQAGQGAEVFQAVPGQLGRDERASRCLGQPSGR